MPSVEAGLAFDTIFLLPELPRSAVVMGRAAAVWRPALEDLGIAVVEGRAKVDLVVAPAASAPSLGSSDATTVLVDGMVAPADRRGARCYLALPATSSPTLLVDVGSARVGAAAAVMRWGDVAGPRDLAEHATLAAGVVAGRVPSGAPMVSVVSRGDTMPAIVRALTQAGVGGRPRSWFLVLTRGSNRRRGVFFVDLADGDRAVVKFSRRRGVSEKFDREERGLSLAAETGGVVAACAPRSLGRFEVDGFLASAQTAVPGQDLGQVLRGPLPRAVKVRALDRVASWLADVARTTRGPAELLSSEWERLRPLPGAPALMEGLDVGAIPSVFAHGDLADGNIVMSLRSMHAVDWELAQRHALPLGDLLYFVMNALPLLDGVAGLEPNVEYLAALFRGDHRSSGLLFRWVRALVDASGVRPGDVGRLAALSWLDRAAARVDFFREAGGDGVDPWPVPARLADVWLRDPVLGADWSMWQR